MAAVGSPISTKDHIEAILDGLPEEYDSFVTTITSRFDPYIVEDVESLLLAQEQRFERNRVTGEHLLQANMATTFSSPTVTMFARQRFTSSMSQNGRGQF